MTGLRERNKSKRRTAILDAATALLRQQEFADVTVEQVAALAEVSPHTVYNLVGTRDELAYALVGRVVRQMASTAPVLDQPAGDASEGLRVVTDHCVDALTAEPMAYRSIIRSVAVLPEWPPEGRQPRLVYDEAARLLDDAGVLRPGLDHRVVARHALIGMFGSIMGWARGQAEADFRQDARLNLAVVLASTTTGAVRDRALRDVDRLGDGVSRSS